MDAHFRAFSFVDRIHTAEAGKTIRGGYAIPPGLDEFPSSLVAEAVGQLAAWAAMSAVDYTCRPVAGLAGRVELFMPARPGQLLELAAEIESVDQEAVAYGGTASVDGRTVIELEHCVGPMMPLAEFDDPALVRQRFDLLTDTGAAPHAFAGVPAFTLRQDAASSGPSLRATLQVPATGIFFADHFPRRPVFPGTLLNHANLQLASALMDTIVPPPAGQHWYPRLVSDVKLRSFITPGETLELEARAKAHSAESALVLLQVRSQGKNLGSCRVSLALESAE